MATPRDSLYLRYGKRVFDVVVSSMALVALTPLLGVLGVAARIALGSPVVFRQRRVGRDGSAFTLIKLRTMLNTKGPDGELLPDAQRMTRFGEWLRRTSIDELPELLNVLKGEMSLIGPRPFHTRYLPRYNDRQRGRHVMRPGLTGLAQVRGRNRISWEERFDLDLSYVEQACLRLDLQILFETVWVIFRQSDVLAEQGPTMVEFWGDAGPPKSL